MVMTQAWPTDQAFGVRNRRPAHYENTSDRDTRCRTVPPDPVLPGQNTCGVLAHAVLSLWSKGVRPPRGLPSPSSARPKGRTGGAWARDSQLSRVDLQAVDKVRLGTAIPARHGRYRRGSGTTIATAGRRPHSRPRTVWATGLRCGEAYMSRFLRLRSPRHSRCPRWTAPTQRRTPKDELQYPAHGRLAGHPIGPVQIAQRGPQRRRSWSGSSAAHSAMAARDILRPGPRRQPGSGRTTAGAVGPADSVGRAGGTGGPAGRAVPRSGPNRNRRVGKPGAWVMLTQQARSSVVLISELNTP